MVYFDMQEIKWDALKNRKLKEIRGASFEDLLNSKFIGLYKHPTRRNQFLLLCEYEEYVWVIPCTINLNDIFLKTLYRSRKFTRMYTKGEIK